MKKEVSTKARNYGNSAVERQGTQVAGDSCVLEGGRTTEHN